MHTWNSWSFFCVCAPRMLNNNTSSSGLNPLESLVISYLKLSEKLLSSPVALNSVETTALLNFFSFLVWGLHDFAIFILLLFSLACYLSNVKPKEISFNIFAHVSIPCFHIFSFSLFLPCFCWLHRSRHYIMVQFSLFSIFCFFLPLLALSFILSFSTRP